MSFLDAFKGKQYKKELEELKKSKMSIEQMDAFELQQLNRDVEKLTKNKES